MAAARRLVLVRHGETVGRSSVRYYGATDVALSDAGRSQMERVREALRRETFDAVYCSGLQRTRTAARIIAPHLPAQVVTGFNEIDFGEWEGLTREEIEARDPSLYAVWRSDLAGFTYPRGDSVPAFRRRVVETFRELLPALPARALLVVHRGIVLTILAELLGLSEAERAALPTALGSIHALVRSNGNGAGGPWHAERLNHTAHLADDDRAAAS